MFQATASHMRCCGFLLTLRPYHAVIMKIKDRTVRCIFIEQHDKNSKLFRSDGAKNITPDKAFSVNIVSINDWRKYARKIHSNGNEEILKFENYEIAVTNDECTIRPLSR